MNVLNDDQLASEVQRAAHAGYSRSKRSGWSNHHLLREYPACAAPHVIYTFIFSCFLCVFLTGCPPKEIPSRAYFGDTDPMEKVVAEINRNNIKLPTVRAELRYDASLVEHRGDKPVDFGGDGGLLYRSPQDLLVRFNKDVAGKVLEIGSSATEYWVQSFPPSQPSTTWWGRYANIGKPCVKDLPIRPDLLLEVLGVGIVGEDFLAQPVPIMRFNNDADAYMFIWAAKARDRWVALKEVWYDRVTKRPTVVLLFDRDGRIILRAYLSEHRQVEMADAKKEDWPWMAGTYRLFFPDSGTKITFSFTDVKLQYKGVPRDRNFVRPDEDTTDRVNQVDANCAD